ncbi:DUF1656 domain-containing protein [Microvirga pudoricolor]|uniref:DUF1656 domain-containing protein n=1 Tax=Microvirga pudoricolor TaxID=2778729 RepID=UPI001951EE60|nr:DUF1656 domain-containing protein [Microvirga pudoricolor]MBM6592537.1 DUF1656 domain-containing protein [Microvirga pudoricolor]
MIKEIDLFGVFVPPLLAYAAAAFAVWYVLREGLSAVGIYRFVWHAALFNTALYGLILSVIVIAIFR